MFEFFKKKKVLANFSGISTDMHSHLLPGIDDGSPDVETSIALIRGLMELGYKKFTTTPHIMWDIYQNTHETINAAHTVLKNALKKEKIKVNIRAAAEYFLDDHFDQLLEDKTPLLTIHNNLVLVEFSFVNSPFDLKEKLFKLQMSGYQPVLAHPERYLYFRDNKEFYNTLKNAGCLFQLNLLSLSNYYGKASTELAHYLIKKEYIDLLGTDLHHERHLESLRFSGSTMGTINKLLDSGKILNGSF
ncbi:MAG: CpsB/CapC family capsule biosynthesis tyrosine phosphatase [Chitinophagaceae bacterium]